MKLNLKLYIYVFVLYEMVEFVKATTFTEYCSEIPGGMLHIQQGAVIIFNDYLRRPGRRKR